MTTPEAIYTMACSFAGTLSQEQAGALKTLCMAAETELRLRLRPGLAPDDCGENFICAAAWLALAGFAAGSSCDGVSSFSAGEMRVQKEKTAAAGQALRAQAEQIMAPYIQDSFTFVGVPG